MTERKSFFIDRSIREMQGMQVKKVYSSRNLVRKILDFNSEEEVLELRMPLLPGRFYQGAYIQTMADASRKAYKHGDLIALSQPRTQKEAHQSREIPLDIRRRDFGKLRSMKEEEINFVGFSWIPVQGNDRRKRVIPFYCPIEGTRIFGYAEKNTGGVEVHPYADAMRVSKEGAEIVCMVPSRTKKKVRYKMKLKHVPTVSTPERKAVVWSLNSSPEEGREPEHGTYNIKYNFETAREGSDVFTFDPHEIAAYIAVFHHYHEKEGNLTPLEMNPFPLPSRLEVDFYNRLRNNVMTYDPSLSGKRKLRPLHIAEKSVLIARSIAVLGHDETMFASGKRDGPIRDYNWSIPNLE